MIPSSFKSAPEAFQREFLALVTQAGAIDTAEQAEEFADNEMWHFSDLPELTDMSPSTYLRRAADVVENLEAWYAEFGLKAPAAGQNPQWRDFLYIHLFAFINGPMGDDDRP